MRNIRPVRPVTILLALVLIAGAAGTAFAQAMNAVSVDGTVASLSGGKLTLTAADGTTKEAVLSPGTIILERQKAALTDVQKGDAMGVTAHRAEDGNMTATIINIFPSGLYKVVKKGQFPMQQPGQIMTNAVVSAYVAQEGKGHQLSMKYGKDTYPIVVPDDTQVFRLLAVDRGMVKEGMHILVRGTQNADGTVKASSVSFDG